MDTIIVLKFGGSSVADNIKLNVVAEKIISLKKEAKNIVVVVSAQGKTTDGLIKEAQELSAIPEEREMDMLLSTGEQITSSKLSILLNRMGHKAISLTGWQAGIITNNIHQNAKIENIQTERIEKELQEGKIVVVTGFQGVDENGDITTLGRGGSDTSAVALHAALKADKCYIFSDVDGIYSADPNMITMAKRLNEISFDEMQEIADSGAKVLHNRCVQLGKKFNCNIIAKSTFSNEGGTKICQEIESSEVKSIVKNEKLIEINLTTNEFFYTIDIYQELLNNNIIAEKFRCNESSIHFIVNKAEETKTLELLERLYPDSKITKKSIIKLSIVGFGIIQDNIILNEIIKVLKINKIGIKNIDLSQSKIEILVNNMDETILEKLHKKLIK